jgi:hypothetical protein
MQIDVLKNKLYSDLKTVPPEIRRAHLIAEMKSLSEKQVHCFNCTGTCCTMSANSMQVTPLEAFEMILSLHVTTENVEALKNKLRENIANYRLDHEISLGKKAQAHLRKTYTCPFFVPGPKGCTIKKDLKPYGCLGFNPRLLNDNGSSCHSDQEMLLLRETENFVSEKAANDFLKNELNLYWTKLEIPKAMLILLEKLF